MLSFRAAFADDCAVHQSDSKFHLNTCTARYDAAHDLCSRLACASPGQREAGGSQPEAQHHTNHACVQILAESAVALWPVLCSTAAGLTCTRVGARAADVLSSSSAAATVGLGDARCCATNQHLARLRRPGWSCPDAPVVTPAVRRNRHLSYSYARIRPLFWSSGAGNATLELFATRYFNPLESTLARRPGHDGYWCSEQDLHGAGIG